MRFGVGQMKPLDFVNSEIQCPRLVTEKYCCNMLPCSLLHPRSKAAHKGQANKGT